MARIRTIKPGFFRSEDVSVLPLRARLTWIGLWTHCDDQGRAKDNPRLIKADVWPLDPVSLPDIEEDLQTLADHGRIVRYEVDGRGYLVIANWSDHQTINKPTPSKLPPPPSPSRNGHGPLRESSGRTTSGKGKEEEGKGREGTRGRARESPPTDPTGPEPPRTCPDHQADPDPPPCGRCRDTRLDHDTWERHRASTTAEQRSAQARQRAEANATASASCQLCDTSGYRNGRTCPHDPDQATRTRVGAATARAALTKNRPTEQETTEP